MDVPARNKRPRRRAAARSAAPAQVENEAVAQPSMPLPPEVTESLAATGIAVMQQFGQVFLEGLQLFANPLSGSEPSPLTAKFLGVQSDWLTRMGDLYAASMLRQLGESPSRVAAPDAGDKRFQRVEWERQPALDFIKQFYLIGAQYLMDLADAMELDDKIRGRVRFFTRQLIDAASPANLAAANPDVVQAALESGGASLVTGMQNLLDDVAHGRVRTTDEAAFELGREIATTKGAVIFENEIMQLIQYAPLGESVRSRPLLIVPPCINKFYILDLQPENSLVRYAVEQGNTVFLISWRNVDERQGHLTWDDYIENAVIRAIATVREITGAERINGLGFCVGGTMLSCAAAVLCGRGEDRLASLTLLASMLDYSDTGEIGLLVDEAGVQLREQTIGGGGILPARDLSIVFQLVRANDLFWPYVINNYLKGTKPAAFDLLFWNADSTNLPGPYYCWYLRNTYLENNLPKPGGTVQCGVPVDFRLLRMPVYILATEEDHIVPWRTAFLSTTLLSGPVRFVLGASGHVAGIVNPPSKNRRHFSSDGEAGKSAAHWKETARQSSGSWWSDWGSWLAALPDTLLPARHALGGGGHRVIEPAPGRYVRVKAED